MTLVSWAKKELARLKFQSPKRLLPPQPTFKPSSNYIVSPQENEVSEVVLTADLRCTKCQERLEAMVSSINNDLESIVVHVIDKKVTFTRKTMNRSS